MNINLNMNLSFLLESRLSLSRERRADSRRRLKFRLVCKHFHRLNFSAATVWLHGCIVTQLGDVIFGFFKSRSVHKQMVKQLKKVKIQLGLSVLCKQSKNIERFRVNEMFSRSKICPLACDGSLNVSTVMKKTAHGEEMAVIGRWLLEEVRLCQITTIPYEADPKPRECNQLTTSSGRCIYIFSLYFNVLVAFRFL